jgi:hypothetical protein
MSQNWSKGLREFLASTYQYDKETGYVMRKYEPNKGPKQRGSVGSVTKGNDLILVVWFEEKAYSIRVARLCVFLETGFLYEKVSHKDGVKLNHKWDNLVPTGIPVDEDGKSLILTAQAVEQAVEEFKTKKKELEERSEVERQKIKEQTSTALEAHKRSKELPTKVEPFVDYQANWAKSNAIEAQRRLDWESTPFMRDYLLMQRKYEAKLVKYKHLAGIHTGMKLYEMEEFARDCTALDGKSTAEFYAENNLTTDKETAPKWVVDRLKAGFFEKMVAGGKLGKKDVETFLKKYRWKGEEVAGPYGELSVEDTRDYLEELRELESIHQTTYEALRVEYKQAS